MSHDHPVHGDFPPRKLGLRWIALACAAAAIVVITLLAPWRTRTAPQTLPIEFRKAWDAFEAQRTVEAEKLVAGLMRHRDHGPSYLVLDAAVSLHHGDFEAAETRIQAAKATGELRPYALEILGRSYYWRNQWYDAEQVFGTLAKEVPRSYAAHLWLGVVYHDSHMFGQAMHELQLAAELQPNNPHAHILQASILYRYGRYHKAAEEYQRALRLIPPPDGSNSAATSPIVVYLVRCLVRDGQFEAGIKQLIDFADPPVELQILRAECFLGLGQLAEAEQECRRALERDENQQEAVITLVKIALQQMVTEEHVQLLDAAYSRNPNDPDVTFLLSQVHGRLGNQQRQQELLAQSQRLQKLRSRSLELMDAVWSQPEDVESRLELATIFSELGDAAQSKQWRQAAAGCEQRVRSFKGTQQ